MSNSTIGDLRNFLNNLPNDDETNDIELRIHVSYGYGCEMVVSDVDFDIEPMEYPGTDKEQDYLLFTGEEDEKLSSI